MGSMDSEASPLTDVVLDSKYRLAELIGQGGMGAVYRAQHIGTQRPVAIKVLRSQLLSNPEAIERFRREARAAGRLRHPNVVDVTDFGIASVDGRDIAYIAMEYLEGTTLRQLIDERGALPVDIVLEIVEQIAAALDVAHAAGIVHRDLKPDNVWLVHDARGGYAIRVLDFGIASSDSGDAVALPVADVEAAQLQLPAGEQSDGGSTRFYPAPTEVVNSGGRASQDPDFDYSGRLTTAGAIVGTPHYMSPEQIRGETVGPASDVYALGVLAWEAIAGRRPFRGKVEEVIDAHLRQSSPALPKASAAVSAVLARAMAKPVGERYGTARAFAGSLRVAAEGPGVIVRRSLALYVNRFSEMSALSWRCGRMPALLVVAMLPLFLGMVVLSGSEGRVAERTLAQASLWAILGWVWVTMFTNASFALAMQRLRARPLERLDAAAVAIELRERLGLPPDAGEFRTAMKLAAFYVRCEYSSRAGAGDLAFLVGLLERKSFAEVPPRCAELFAASRPTYRRVAVGVFAALLLPPAIEASVLAHLFSGLGSPGLLCALVLAVSLMPINAILLNPIFSSAFSLLYYRSCQALGEDVPMAAVIPSRL